GISDSTNAIRGMLAKLNGYSGEIMWHKVVGETGNYYVQGAQDVTIAPDGSYLFGGEFSGNGIFGSDIIQAAGYLDIFLMKTDTSGNIKWVTTGGSVGFDKLYSIFQCKSGDICFTGGYSDGFKMGDSILYSKGYTDVYAGAIDSTGKLKWILHGGSNIPGHETDFFYHEYGAGIFEDSKEQLQIVGTTIGNGSFGNLRYIASENTWENVFWATIGSNKKNYSVYYPCDTFSGNSLINIYPNPFKDEFTIQLYESFLTEGESSMRLFDVSGRLIMTEKTSSNLLTVKNLQLLASGVYIAEIVNKHRRKTVKLIKEN
ncbi:MAG TPA: T9SS type A sorting domain-containing protein, partial [Puia sp.]|nr:T9SS type A sorting domain-containing protein [Puia sp.]